MKLAEYKIRAVEIAQKDSKAGFKFHILRSPLSSRIEALTGSAIADGLNPQEVDQLELTWQNSLFAKHHKLSPLGL